MTFSVSFLEHITLYQGKHAPRQKRRHALTGSHVEQNMPPWAKTKRLKLRLKLTLKISPHEKSALHDGMCTF